MNLKGVERLSPESFEFLGHSYPVAGIMEGADGVRVLICPMMITNSVWNRAIECGVGLLACYSPIDWTYCDTEYFINHREPVQGGYEFPYRHQLAADELIDFSTFVQRRTHAKVMNRDGFVNVHTHSEASPLDGLSTVDEMVEFAVDADQPAIAVTDHGVVTAHPYLQLAADQMGIRPIFGIEAYWVPDRHLKEKESLWSYYHLILWAENDVGLRNLWAASTEANRTGFYSKARCDWDILERFSEGVIASTACLRGPITNPLLNGRMEEAQSNLLRLQAIFRDRLYMEIHCNALPEQIFANKHLVDLAHSAGVPLIAAVDSHYPCADDYLAHQIWLKTQMHKAIDKQETGDSALFAGHQEYHLMKRSEVAAKLSYLDEADVIEALDNTVALSERCTARVGGKVAPPVFSRVGGPERDAERLGELCRANWHKTEGNTYPQEIYEQRYVFEMNMLIRKSFCGYFCCVSRGDSHSV